MSYRQKKPRLFGGKCRRLMITTMFVFAVIFALAPPATAQDATSKNRIVAVNPVRQTAVFSVGGELQVVASGKLVGSTAFRLVHITSSNALMALDTVSQQPEHRFTLKVGDFLPAAVPETRSPDDSVRTSVVRVGEGSTQ